MAIRVNKIIAKRSAWLDRQKPGMKSMLRKRNQYGPKSEDFRPSLKKLIFGSEAEPYAESFHKSEEGNVPVVVDPDPKPSV